MSGLRIGGIDTVLRRTKSVCPVCLIKLDASIIVRGHDYFLKKKCHEHGAFSTVIWRGKNPSFEQWEGDFTAQNAQSRKNTKDSQVMGESCPDSCGLCPAHLQKTCCALVEITQRCNLSCSFCFAGSGGCDIADAAMPTLSALGETFNTLAAQGNTFVQLSGGEPTMREYLPDIITLARTAGCDTVQLNSNGIRLGEDPDFTRQLRDAGLSFVFMQFDGTNDDVYLRLRGAKLLEAKLKAIKACGENMIGVTLVPTIVPGVNDDNIGDIIKFAVENSPQVRGVHFQPVSYFGRYPQPPEDRDRITLPEILHAIEAQTKGKFTLEDFAPSACDHPRCGFHGDFVVLPNSKIMKLTKKGGASCCCAEDAHLKNRNFVSRRWNRAEMSEESSGLSAEMPDMRDMDTFLNRVKTHGFTITAMAFQDAYNLDLERLRRCSLHVARGGKIIPFCANYMTEVSI